MACCLVACGVLLFVLMAAAEEAPVDDTPAAEKVELPGIKIDVKNRRLDVDATVSLDEGLLEVVACTADSREHESVVLVKASPTHIHAALLLLGANNGHPAMTKPVNEEGTRFVHLPPRGDPIAVSLVITDDKGNATERPISDFVKAVEQDDDDGFAPNPANDEGDDASDPAKVFEVFVFAGSHVVKDEKGEKHYLAEQSGNVVSISTFGDEVLCLPEIHSKANGELAWEINDEHLPKVGTKVKLRLTLIEDLNEEQPADEGDAE